MDNELIQRIQEMEERYNRVRKATDALQCSLDAYLDVQEDIHILDSYENSGRWLRDFEADERGEIPAEIPRGFLTEDGLYNLMADIAALESRLQEYFGGM
jgi:hypothetical protein